MEGTVFQLAALRALGARIGERVHIHRGVDLLQGGWDLLDIGDDVTIGQEALVQLVDLEDEQIVVAPIRIGSNATVDIRASVGGGATIEDGGYLATLSSLPPGARLLRGERWDGVPAAPAGRAPDPPPLDRVAHSWPPLAHGAARLVTRIGSMLLAPAIASLAAAWMIHAYAVDAAALDAWLARPFFDGRAMLLISAAALLSAPLSLVIQLVLIRLLGRVRPGVVGRWTAGYFRVWAKTDLLRKAGDWLSGTLLWGMWLRAAGMRVGRDSEISTIIDVVPELVSIGDSTFCADGIYLGGPRVHRGTVTLAETRLGRGLFLGNHVVIPAGVNVPDDVLLGVCTVAHHGIEPGSAWFGHPPFRLSRPAQPKLDPSLTHRPSLLRLVNRWFWELGRFAIPVAPALAALELARLFAAAHDRYSEWAMALLVMPALVAAGATAMCALVLAMKWLLLGRVRPGEHALWSCWCSRWDFHYTLWDRLATPVLSRLEGTLLLGWYLRATGMRIGKRVVLGPGFAQVVDPDMIQIDDDATVHALFQAHTFEDRLLKIDRVRIRARANVGSGAVVFYGVDIGEGASVAPQSVIMKRERLAAGGHYEGCPSQRTMGPALTDLPIDGLTLRRPSQATPVFKTGS
jgi:non-ribosomal peptide synthetase-like protein